jgi:hypothetical protein
MTCTAEGLLIKPEKNHRNSRIRFQDPGRKNDPAQSVLVKMSSVFKDLDQIHFDKGVLLLPPFHARNKSNNQFLKAAVKRVQSKTANQSINAPISAMLQELEQIWTGLDRFLRPGPERRP